jgi:hypothetical protein
MAKLDEGPLPTAAPLSYAGIAAAGIAPDALPDAASGGRAKVEFLGFAANAMQLPPRIKSIQRNFLSIASYTMEKLCKTSHSQRMC